MTFADILSWGGIDEFVYQMALFVTFSWGVAAGFVLEKIITYVRKMK